MYSLVIVQKQLDFSDMLTTQQLVIEPIGNGQVEFRFEDTHIEENNGRE